MGKESALHRRARVKLQLRDKHGRWIEMGGGVKWFSSRLNKEVSGTVVGTQNEDALVRLNKEKGSDAQPLVKVPARHIEVVDSKAHLGQPGEKPSADTTPEFEKPDAVAKVPVQDTALSEEKGAFDGKKLSEVSAEDMSKMPAGTRLSAGDNLASFTKQEGDNWQHMLSNGKTSGTVSTSAAVKNSDTFQNHVFGAPEPKYTDMADPQDHSGSFKPYITKTSDGNTYISAEDGGSIYTPARSLAVGDELVAPDGAQPEKPFSIGKGWAKKKAERVNTSGPKTGKVVSIEPDRYAVVQLPEGHTVTDVNTGNPTSQVTVGMGNDVIKLTPELKSALGDALTENGSNGPSTSHDGVNTTPNAPAHEASPDAASSPAPEQAPSPAPAPAEAVQDHNAPAPEAPAPAKIETPAPEVKADPQKPEKASSSLADVTEGVARIEQDMQDIDSHNLKGEDLASALEEAKHDITGANGVGYTISAVRDGQGEWSYNLADENGTDKGNWIAANYDSSEPIAKEIHDTVNGTQSSSDAKPETAPAEAAPAAPQAETYNENGLTAEEQATVTALTRMIGRAETGGQFDRADALSAQMADLVAKGEARKSSQPAAQPDAPSAPQANPSGAQDNSPAARIKNAEIMYGTGSPQHKQAIERWGNQADNASPAPEKAPQSDQNAPQAPDTAPAPEKAAEQAPADSQLESLVSDIQFEQTLAPDARRAISQHVQANGEEASGYRVTDSGRQFEVTDLAKAQQSLRDIVSSINAQPATSRNANVSRNRVLREVRSLLTKVNAEAANNNQDHNNAPDANAPEASAPVANAPEKSAEKSPSLIEPDPAPQQSPEATAKADEALAQAMPTNKVNVTFARATSGLDQAIVDSPELMSPEEAAQMRRLNHDLAMAQHNNQSGRESLAKHDIEKLAQQINDRINAESKQDSTPQEAPANVSAPENSAPSSNDKGGSSEGNGSAEAKSTAPEPQKPVEDKKAPEEQQKPEPISDEQAGRVLTTLTSENPLPAGIERHVPEAVAGEDYAPTQQQQDVIDAVLGGLDTLVQAKAGAGKTSTLRAIARRLKINKPDAKIGYIAFNKSVQLEANGSMPDNTEARTGHSVAVAWAPEWMTRRTRVQGNLSRPSDVANHLGIYGPLDNNGSAFSPNSQAMAVKRTLATFANSADDNISVDHLPDSVKAMPSHVQSAILEYSNRAWKDMQDQNGQLRMSLDQIRKQWALSKPDFSKPGSGLSRPVSVLFLDEAQDTPPVLAKVIADQKNVQKVIVGDADQAIYGFTGATDYLSNAQGDVELPLNKSWRFGPAVADMGNRFLQIAGSRQRVVGGGESTIVENMDNADAVLVRSNGGMLSEIASELERGRTVGVPAKTKDDLKSLIETARYLRGEGSAPSRGLHEDLADFRSWGEFLDEVDKGDDQNLSKIARMVDTFGLDKMENLIDSVVETGGSVFNSISFEDHPTAGLIARGDTFPAKDFLRAAGFRWVTDPSGSVIPAGRRNAGQREKVWAAPGTPDQRERALAKARELGAQSDPDVVISTAHKSKGLEWDRVRIGDDFWQPKVDPNTGEVEMVKPEELRLNYVAVTRAAKELDLGSLAWVLDHSDENGGNVPEANSDNAPDASKPSLQSSDEGATSPVKDAPAEPVTDAPSAETSPVEDVPATDAPPQLSEDGLTEAEQSMLDYFNRRLAGAYQNQNSDNINDLEREIDGLMAHGERRNAGETLGEYTPAPVEDQADAPQDPPAEKLPEPVPMGRRSRADYSGVILKDANGNDLAFGDTVGHRTHGPVVISGIVAGSGRVQFLHPTTGRTSSVDARLVTRIDANAPTADAPAENTSVGTPTEPGTLFIDPSTGQKAFIDKNGNKVVHGDKVTDRRGNTGEVVGVYRAADGKAWPAIKFEDGSTRRIKGHLVSKEGTDAPAETPAAPSAPEVAPTVSEVAPSAPEAPAEVAPEAPSAPEVPAPVDTPSESVPAPESSSGGIQMTSTSATDRSNMIANAPIGSTITSQHSPRVYTKQQDGWHSDRGITHIPWTNEDIAGITDPNSPRGISTLTHGDGPSPNAPASPEAPGNGTELPANRRGNAVRELDFAVVGSKLTAPDGRTYTKVSNAYWKDSNGNELPSTSLIEDINRGGWRLSDPESTPIADNTLLPTTDDRRAIIMSAPVGTRLRSLSGVTVEKLENGRWVDITDRSINWASASVNLLTGSGQWTLNPRDEAPSTPSAPAAPSGPDLLSNDEAERLATMSSLPIGSTVSKNGISYEKVNATEWKSSFSGTLYNQAVLAQSTRGGDWQITRGTAPAEPFKGGELSSDYTARAAEIASLPEGSSVTGGRNNRAFIRRGPDLWSTEERPSEYYSDDDLNFVTRSGNPPVAALPAPTPEGVHSGLANGSFIPNAEGSTTGMRRVSDNKWEMVRDGKPTGRFATDEMAQMLMDMSDTKIQKPSLDLGTDLNVADLGLGGKSFGEWMRSGGRMRDLTQEQKANIRAGYERFVQNLNTNLPAGVKAEIDSFNTDYGSLKTIVSFYKGSTKLGSATRVFGLSTDPRTNRQVSSVDHAYYTLNSSQQGGGISSAFLKASKQFYRQLGLDKITIHANIDVGGYAWARGGFDFSSYSSMMSAISDWKSRANWQMPHGREAEWAEGKRKFDELVARATEANFRAGTHPTPIEFSEIGRPEGSTGRTDMWYGKSMMLNSDWFGSFPLGVPAPTA